MSDSVTGSAADAMLDRLVGVVGRHLKTTAPADWERIVRADWAPSIAAIQREAVDAVRERLLTYVQTHEHEIVRVIEEQATDDWEERLVADMLKDR